MKKISIVLASLVMAACASSPKTVAPQAAQASEKAAPAPVKAEVHITPKVAESVSTAEMEAQKLKAELQDIQKKSVYFNYDQYSVRPEYQDVLLKQAQFIKEHKNDVVTVEGNTDERGSSEYNLALGEKRAEVARKYLEMQGVPITQIKTLSLGLEKPRLACHEEKCWQENRRDDFIHTIN